jgi:hypothetical protein
VELQADRLRARAAAGHRGEWWTDGSRVWASFGAAPAPGAAELTVRSRVFAPHRRGLAFISVSGFTIEHGANQFPDAFFEQGRAAFAQSGLLGTRTGYSWVIRNNTLQHAKTIGLDIGSEGSGDNEGAWSQAVTWRFGNHTVERNIVSDNGGGGIQGAFLNGTGPGYNSTGGYSNTVYGGVISYNRVERNNFLQCGAYEASGIKTHGFAGTVEGNLVANNTAYTGIWFDYNWKRVRLTRNVIVDNGPFRGEHAFVARPGDQGWTAGVMFEISNEGEALVDNNIIAGSDGGPGVYGQDANNVTVAYNLIFGNTGAAVYLGGITGRQYARPTPGCGVGRLGRTDVTMNNWVVAGNVLLARTAGACGAPPHHCAAAPEAPCDTSCTDWGAARNTTAAWCPRGGPFACQLCNNSWVDNVVSGTAGGTAAPVGSTASDVRVRLDRAGLRLRIASAESLWGAVPRGLPGSDVDFTGAARRGAGAAVRGPFASLRRGEQAEVELWPVPEAAAQPPYM